MMKTGRMATYIIVAAGAFQLWHAGVIPVRGDEAYIYLKSSGLSWFSFPGPGISGVFIDLASRLGNDIFILRLPSILLMSFAALFVFKSAELAGGSFSAWAALLLFLLTPSVGAAYTSATPAASLAFFVSIGVFFWLRSLKKVRTADFLAAGLASGAALACDLGGSFLFFSVLLYFAVFKRDLILSKNFLYAFLTFAFFPVLIGIEWLMGNPMIPGDFPFIYTETKAELFFMGAAVLPAILYVIAVMFRVGKVEPEVRLLQVIFSVALLLYVLWSLKGGFDIRNLPALFIPAFILGGYYCSLLENKVFFATILAVSLLLSVYVKVAPAGGEYIPSAWKGSEVYRSLADPGGFSALFSGAVIAENPADASTYAFYLPNKPEACVIGRCASQSGLFVTDKKDFPVGQYFAKTEEAGVYRMTSPKEGSKTLYVYLVENP